MNEVEQIQRWLVKNGYDPGKIDGKFGDHTQAALMQAQRDLAEVGLYKGLIDGRIGNKTRAAIAAFNSGVKHFTSGLEYNQYSRRSLENAYRKLLERGVGTVNLGNNRTIRIGGDGDIDTFISMLSNGRLKSALKGADYRSSSFSEIARGLSRAGSKRAKSTGTSSFSNQDLDHLLLRYMFDMYHGNDMSDKYGIRYNYTRTGTGSAVAGRLKNEDWATITMEIDPKKWTLAQAEQIARGAGEKTYIYGGKKYNVNLFAGSKYKDQNDFQRMLDDTSIDVNARQKAFNDEILRQYNTYGIDYTALANKNNGKWNILFGIIPYGYSGEAVRAFQRGEQAMMIPEIEYKSSGLTTASPQYRYDSTSKKGRLKYKDYDEWYRSYMLGDSSLQANGGLGVTRATAASYALGLPVDARTRGEFRPVGARPDTKDGQQVIDTTAWYTQPNGGEMKPYMHTIAAAHPTEFYNYLKAIFGERSKKRNKEGNYEVLHADRKSAKKLDLSNLDKLAAAAGMDSLRYHRANGGSKRGYWLTQEPFKSPFGSIDTHDVWGSLRSFYENAYDANGNLRTDSYKYSENGYNYGVDGGAYTVFVNNNKPTSAQDTWDWGFLGFGNGLSNGSGGVRLITRYNKLGGLLRFCQSWKVGGQLPKFGGGGDMNSSSSEGTTNYQFPQNVGKGKVYVLYYPDYMGSITKGMNDPVSQTFGKGIRVLNGGSDRTNVGHVAMITVTPNGTTKYYEYGRYNTPEGGTYIGYHKNNFGNYLNVTIPNKDPNESDEAYFKRVRSSLPHNAAGKLKVTAIDDVDLDKVYNYLQTDAFDPKRSKYSYAKTCATVAEAAVRSGLNWKHTINDIFGIEDHSRTFSGLGSVNPWNAGSHYYSLSDLGPHYTFE